MQTLSKLRGTIMLGNILIDKIQINIPLKGVNSDEKDSLVHYIDNVLGEHYAKNAYGITVNNNAKLKLWFTPTRYFDDMAFYYDYTDTNLEMPQESKLKELFNKMLSHKILTEVIPEIKITKFDLTKNFITSRKSKYYLDALSVRRYKNGYKAISHDCGYYSKTVSITRLLRNPGEKDNAGDEELKFYDKVRELLDKHIQEIILKEPLPAEDKNSLTLKNYNPLFKRFPLGDLNLLRAEWHFGRKKLYKISRYCNFENPDEGLFLVDFMNLLNSGNLYKVLDGFYTEYTLNLLKAGQVQTSSLSIYDKILCKYYPDVVSLPLIGVFKDNNLYKKYHKCLLKVQTEHNDILIQEIINKIEEYRIKE